MAIAFVTELEGWVWDGSTGSTIPNFSTWAPGTGSLIVVGITWEATSARTITSVTDVAGNTYVDSGAGRLSGGPGFIQMYYAYNVATNASNKVTVNFSGAVAERAMIVVEYSGVKTSADPNDTGSTGTATANTTVTSGSFTPSETGTVAIAFTAKNGGTANIVSDANYVERGEITDLDGAGTRAPHMQDRLSAPASAQTASASQTGNTDWRMIVRTFKAAASDVSTALSGSAVTSGRGTPVPNFQIAL